VALDNCHEPLKVIGGQLDIIIAEQDVGTSRPTNPLITLRAD
jgi:hypothetical protein